MKNHGCDSGSGSGSGGGRAAAGAGGGVVVVPQTGHGSASRPHNMAAYSSGSYTDVFICCAVFSRDVD